MDPRKHLFASTISCKPHPSNVRPVARKERPNLELGVNLPTIGHADSGQTAVGQRTFLTDLGQIDQGQIGPKRP